MIAHRKLELQRYKICGGRSNVRRRQRGCALADSTSSSRLFPKILGFPYRNPREYLGAIRYFYAARRLVGFRGAVNSLPSTGGPYLPLPSIHQIIESMCKIGEESLVL
jgi:hypothetical protein